MARQIAPGLRVLVDRLIDYAGTFPPATLARDAAVANYVRYCGGEFGWMIRWLVVAAADLPHVPAEWNGSLAVLTDADEPRAAVLETKKIIRATRPIYCEVLRSELADVHRAGCFAKLRTGGVTPDAIPSIESIADFIRACAELRLPFKATAGLHHPVRAPHPLTYAADAPRAVMHGFLNVFMAAALAWHGDHDLEPVLAETDPVAFRFDDRAHWRDRFLTVDQVRDARSRFAHAFGSCSFDEPVDGLKDLGLL
jgi:hypothetical protein